MKFNKVFTLFKIVLITFLIANCETRSLSKKSLAQVHRFQSNARKFQSKILDIHVKDVADLLFGVISGYIERQAKNLVDTFEVTAIVSIITLSSLRNSFKTCIPEANLKFDKDADAAKRGGDFNMFVSVLPGAISDTRINKYVETCEKKDESKDKEYTDDHKVFLAKTLEILEKHSKDNPDKDEQKLIDELKTAKDYFDYKDTNYLSYMATKTRTICSYFNREDNWKAIIKRWFDYGTNLITCGTETSVKTTFSKLKNSALLVPLLKTGLINGFAQYLGLGVFKLFRAVYRFMKSLIAGNSNYYAIGQTLGEEIAESFPFVPKVTSKRRRYKY